MNLEIIRERIFQNNPRSDGEETKKADYVSAAGVVPRPLLKQKPTLSLQVNARRDFLDCELFNASLSYVKCMCTALPWMRQPLL